jgi:hypothetical protein
VTGDGGDIGPRHARAAKSGVMDDRIGRLGEEAGSDPWSDDGAGGELGQKGATGNGSHAAEVGANYRTKEEKTSLATKIWIDF